MDTIKCSSLEWAWCQHKSSSRWLPSQGKPASMICMTNYQPSASGWCGRLAYQQFVKKSSLTRLGAVEDLPVSCGQAGQSE